LHISGKYFQLEELEDKESCTTELFFKPDSTVTVGRTDGPRFTEAFGTWEQQADGVVTVVLKRMYGAGRTRIAETDLGEFQFEVERTFLGELYTVGASKAVSGTIMMYGDQEVGFFNLIETTSEREALFMQERKTTM
jgi:hypothetical protein